MRLLGRRSRRDPLLEEFLGLMEGNAHVERCLKSLTITDVVVLPAGRAGAFRKLFPNVSTVSVGKFRAWETEASPESRVILLDAFLEEADCREVERSSCHPGRVYRVLRDLFPCCTAVTGLDNKPVGNLLEQALSRYHERTSLPDLRYFILGAPRSGSHFLCDLLSSVGLGEPKEHVKRPFVNAWDRRTEWNFDARLWFGNVIRAGQVDNVFGTKIVHEIDVAGIQEETGLFSKLFSRGIYLTRRDSVLQAISLYRARTLSYWHDRGSQTERGVLEYSFNEILKVFRSLARQENGIEAGLALVSVPIKHVTYEDLTAEPTKTIEELASFLGRESADLSLLGSSEKKIGAVREDEMARQFESEYQQRFDRACPRFRDMATRRQEQT